MKKSLFDDPGATDLGMGRCKLTCDEWAMMWPRPRQAVMDTEVKEFRTENIRLVEGGEGTGSLAMGMIQDNVDEQIQWLRMKKVS